MAGAKTGATVQVTERPGVSQERQIADIALDPLFGAASLSTTFTKGTFGVTDLTATYDALIDRAEAVRGNQLSSAADMLTAQAAALNAIFLELARRSGANMGEYIQAAETYMRLALKAQGQCRATLETLAAIKNQPVIHAKPANDAAGLAHASAAAIPPNELLETTHDESERLDTGAEVAPGGSYPILEAMGAIDRPTDGRREGERQPQRRPGRKAAGATG